MPASIHLFAGIPSEHSVSRSHTMIIEAAHVCLGSPSRSMAPLPLQPALRQWERTMTESRLKLRAYLLVVMMGAPDAFPKVDPFVGNAALDLARAFKMLREVLKQSEAEFPAEL